MIANNYQNLKQRIENNLNKEIKFNDKSIAKFSDSENIDDFDTELIILTSLLNQEQKYFLQGVVVKDKNGNEINNMSGIDGSDKYYWSSVKDIATHLIECYSTIMNRAQNSTVKLDNISEIENIVKNKIKFCYNRLYKHRI